MSTLQKQYAEGDMPLGRQIKAGMESRKLRPSPQVALFQYTAFTKMRTKQ